MLSKYHAASISRPNKVSLSREKPTEKFHTIQLLRFVAFFIVVVCHATFYTAERLVKGFYQYDSGYNGVVLFFIISGFVMVVSSEKLLLRDKAWQVFAVRRIVRIIPIYWMLTTYKLILMFFASNLMLHSHISLITGLKSYFFIPALNADGIFYPVVGVGWTLNLEMFFYLLFAIALAIRVRPVVFLSLSFIPLFILSFYARTSWPDCRFYAQPLIINFILGILIAKLILNGLRLSKLISMVLLVTGLFVIIIPNEFVLPLLRHNQLYYKLFVFTAAFLVVYSAVSIEKHLKFQIPAWLMFLGGASYSLYLIHPLIAPLAPAIMKVLNLPFPWTAVCAAISLALAGGVLFYLFIERPLTKFLVRKAGSLNLS